jgi:DNA-binding MarR family transcriptional regulator
MPKQSEVIAEITERLPRAWSRCLGRRVVTSGAWELSIPQFLALAIILEQTGCTMGELADALGISMSAATGLANRLVNQELVAREDDIHDRRIIRLRITRPGIRALSAYRLERKQRIKAALELLTETQQREIAASLALLRQALESSKPSRTKETHQHGRAQ